jgi:hypothetical protein
VHDIIGESGYSLRKTFLDGKLSLYSRGICELAIVIPSTTTPLCAIAPKDGGSPFKYREPSAVIMDAVRNVIQDAYSCSTSNEYRVCEALALSQYLHLDQHMWMGLSTYGARSVVIDQSQRELHISQSRWSGLATQNSLLTHPIHYQTKGNNEKGMFCRKQVISLFSHYRYSDLTTNE